MLFVLVNMFMGRYYAEGLQIMLLKEKKMKIISCWRQLMNIRNYGEHISDVKFQQKKSEKN